MKIIKFVLCVILLLSCIIFSEARVYDKDNSNYTVTANTSTATLVGGWLPGRVYYIVINESTYDVRHATWPLTGVDAASATSRGILIEDGLGYWEDKYNVYQSSWYVIINGGGPADVAPYTATITYRERN